MLSFLKRLLGISSASPACTLQIGDRVKDTAGGRHTVVRVELHPEWNSGGWLWTHRDDDGKEFQHSFCLHKLEIVVEQPMPGASFQLGARVGNGALGARGTVIRIKPCEGQSMERISVLEDNGITSTYCGPDHGLIILPPDQREFRPVTPAPPLVRSHPEEADAHADLREDKIYFHGVCHLNIGGIGTGPFRCVDADVSDAEIGQVLLEVLREARALPIPELPSKAPVMEGYYALAGLSGKSAGPRFDKASLSCCVNRAPQGMRFIPTEYEQGGLMHLEPEPFMESHDPAMVGRALRKAFERCVNRHVQR